MSSHYVFGSRFAAGQHDLSHRASASFHQSESHAILRLQSNTHTWFAAIVCRNACYSAIEGLREIRIDEFAQEAAEHTWRSYVHLKANNSAQ